MLTKDETVRLAASCAKEGFLCSESVLIALSKCLGVSNDVVPRLATGFGAGIGRRGEVCGALAGGVMGLGLKFGRCAAEEREDGRRPYWYATELVEGFRSRYHCVRCGDLLGLDLSRPGDVQRYHEMGLWDTRCREIIETAVGLAYDMLVKNI
jgi:C_GCAxxG_C_C family probable redox protein